MGFRFVFGRAGSGKSTLCLEEIRNELRSEPGGAPLILLVPEQATYQMEVALADTPDLGGSLRAQVLSFRRLGWRIFSETGGGQKVLIGPIGKRMLLRKILLKHRLNLKAFARSATRPGMAELLAQAIGEFKIYCVGPNDLLKVKTTSSLLEDKLSDLALIYEEFQAALGLGIRDPDDELSVLAEKIPSAPLIQGAKVWVDGFTGFTPQELEVLKRLVSTAQEVVITSTLDPVFLTEERLTGAGIFQAGDEMFAGPWKTYQDLQRIALETGVQIHPPTILFGSKRYKHPWLWHLEKYYSTYPTVAFATFQVDNNTSSTGSLTNGIQVFSAVNRRAEVEGAARELRRLARDEGHSWNEMAVTSRDLTGYAELIAQVFTAYEIPHFLDYKRPVLHHPLIELLQSILEAIKSNWGYEPLFRCLKTDFFPLQRDAVDRLENYVLEYGIHGDGWTRNQPWKYHRQWTLGQKEEQRASELKFQTELNTSRQTVVDIIAPLAELNQLAAMNVRIVTEALYYFLEGLDVPGTLKLWSQKAQDEGDLAEARLHEQIWESVVQVLDEIVVGLGEENLELEDYALILSSGIEGIELGLIPPGLDQVLVGSLDRSRNPEVRVLFILGANEGILPARPVSDGVLDAEEREQLERAGVALAPKGKAQTFEEQFFIYTALTRAVERLIVCYPLTDEEGKGLTVSPVVTRLTHLFPMLSGYFLGNQEDIHQISQPDSTLQNYAEQLRLLRQGEPLSPLWEAAEKWLSQDPLRKSKVDRLQESLTNQNQEDKLQRPLARRLYGKRLMASVSRLEQFAKCPFGHYARYGLKLRERSTYQLSSPNMGEFFHTLLHDFAQQLKAKGLDWGKLTKQESWTLINELADQIAPSLQHEILLSNARYRYLTHKLKRTVHHAVRVLGEHARKGVFIPIQLEVGFGPQEKLPGVEIPLTDSDSLLLCGQIDRVDAAFLDGQVYLRILDYKSRELSLSLDSIYYGLNLQLLTYLHVALQGAEVLLNTPTVMTDSEEADSENTFSEIAVGRDNPFPEKIPAGFLYFPVLEPQLEEKLPLSSEELDQRRVKAVKVSGYLLANPKVLEAMDSTFSTGQSELLGLKLKKDGTFKKGTNVLTEDQFSLLSNYLQQWFRQKGEEILDGDISLSPYRRGKSTGCQYCSYKPVCHFDPYLPENQYRDLSALKSEEVWERLEGFKAENSDDLLQEQEQELEIKDSKDLVLNWLGEATTESGKKERKQESTKKKGGHLSE
ncbi:helicase-exonuclease AddAB subunit AddB [Desulfosporosinus meridiei]|uniref:ATP-dependent helicase/deoxyribonuclease subunit B n=1 Tax=Desulfosporosinus meridiei (strain ATCC BAA-275 / DSM 13257 / KCTC 12902 / NCIMB 13706 / S10) TaxID=768704 RepID=J7IYH9_DESMD|nr:helicase-exonuclease AddAB subunit AddB [Desulfosporosinus meridiei]AFQ44158.1 DNA helicase/exodeoxyribonuclease V, subunit B [Desulfosporosinus meridiei DSM 13257]